MVLTTARDYWRSLLAITWARLDCPDRREARPPIAVARAQDCGDEDRAGGARWCRPSRLATDHPVHPPSRRATECRPPRHRAGGRARPATGGVASLRRRRGQHSDRGTQQVRHPPRREVGDTGHDPRWSPRRGPRVVGQSSRVGRRGRRPASWRAGGRQRRGRRVRKRPGHRLRRRARRWDPTPCGRGSSSGDDGDRRHRVDARPSGSERRRGRRGHPAGRRHPNLPPPARPGSGPVATRPRRQPESRQGPGSAGAGDGRVGRDGSRRLGHVRRGRHAGWASRTSGGRAGGERPDHLRRAIAVDQVADVLHRRVMERVDVAPRRRARRRARGGRLRCADRGSVSATSPTSRSRASCRRLCRSTSTPGRGGSGDRRGVDAGRPTGHRRTGRTLGSDARRRQTAHAFKVLYRRLVANSSRRAAASSGSAPRRSR